MDELTVDEVLAKISIQLHLSKETEYEVIAEIRTHLEDAVAEAASRGKDEEAALLKAAEDFGIEEATAELQEVHLGRESSEVIAAIALPVLFAVILRWLVFAPDGSTLAWPQLLVRPGFYIIAAVSLVIPVLCFHRWRYVLVGWGVFWLLTVLFAIFPSVNHW